MPSTIPVVHRDPVRKARVIISMLPVRKLILVVFLTPPFRCRVAIVQAIHLDPVTVLPMPHVKIDGSLVTRNAQESIRHQAQVEPTPVQNVMVVTKLLVRNTMQPVQNV